MKKIRAFTNIDVFAIAKELDLNLKYSKISNIYEIEDLIIFKINTDEGKKKFDDSE